MHSDRVNPLLEAVAEVRNWIVAHVPGGASMVGHDLFLKLGHDLFIGRDLDVATICSEFPYPPEMTRQHLALMREAGLVAIDEAADGRSLLRATETFAGLLDRYYQMFDSHFILRRDLRDQQLHIATPDAALARFAATLYDHFYDLGWLYLYNWGAVCFLMASLVRRAALAHGRRAHIASCRVTVECTDAVFHLGAPGYGRPGQIEGHAVCIVDDALLIDFGLGNVRRNFRRDFCWGVACDYRPEGTVMARLAMPHGDVATWLSDWQSPQSEEELRRYEPLVEQLFAQYQPYLAAA